MKDDFACAVTPGTRLEAYIGRREGAVLIELVIEEVPESVSSVCLSVEDARALSATLQNLAERVENHLKKGGT